MKTLLLTVKKVNNYQLWNVLHNNEIININIWIINLLYINCMEILNHDSEIENKIKIIK